MGKKNEAVPPESFSIENLITQIQPSKEDATTYHTPTLERRLAIDPVLRSVFTKIIDGDSEFSTEEQKAMRRGGFQLRTLEDENERWVIIVEVGSWRGAGAYLFRLGEADPIVIQAPHSYHDLMTGEVAFNAFKQTRARAVFFNTAHRYSEKSDVAKGPNPADLSHRTDTFFFIFTETLARLGDHTFVQLHGFEEEAAEKFDMVISDTSTTPSETVTSFANALASSDSKLKIGIFGATTQIYGGTSNPVGRWVKREQRGDFIHVEMTPTLRERWKSGESALTKAIGAAVIDRESEE